MLNSQATIYANSAKYQEKNQKISETEGLPVRQHPASISIPQKNTTKPANV